MKKYKSKMIFCFLGLLMVVALLPFNFAKDNFVKDNLVKAAVTTVEAATNLTTQIAVKGDVNADGVVNLLDYDMIKDHILGRLTDFPVAEDVWVGDVNDDGKINVADIILVKQFCLGNIKVFPPKGTPAKLVASTPTFSVPEATYQTTQTVKISSTDPYAIIQYEINGNKPTVTSAIYTQPIFVEKNEKIMAYATKLGMADSEVASVTYTINASTTDPQPVSNLVVTPNIENTFTLSWTPSIETGITYCISQVLIN